MRYDDHTHCDNAEHKQWPGQQPQQCLHDLCPTCHGTGRDDMGRICVHMISCPCPKCSPTCLL